MSKRPNGEGTIYLDEKSGKWQAQIHVRTPEGQRKRKTLRGKTQRDVARQLREVRQRLDSGMPVSSRRSQTLTEYGHHWVHEVLPAQVTLGTISPRTADGYTTLWLAHVEPGLGHLRLDQLGPAQVRTWLASKVGTISRRKKPLSARSIAAIHSVLRRALRDALREELVTRNVATLVAPPRPERRNVEALTPDEATKMVRAAPDHSLGALWVLLLAMGLRLGEALALRWEDVDTDKGTLAVRRSVGRVRATPDADGKRATALLVGRTKTPASTDVLPLPVVVGKALRQHRAAQAKKQVAAPAWENPGLIFTTETGGLLDGRNVLRAWKSFAKKAGITRDTRLHLLRHSTATFLLSEGVPMEVIRAMLRHTRLATTSDLYAHVTAVLQRDAADVMDGFLGGLGEAK